VKNLALPDLVMRDASLTLSMTNNVTHSLTESQTMTDKTYEFKTDVKQLLDLVTHSLYSHKDIFLRELISNASDAIDKVRFESLTNKDVLESNDDWKIKLIANEPEKTLTISDNGCGMTQDDLINHIGTIAKSGTQEFLKMLQENKAKDNPDFIGQFGVGFYSAFMVADKVVIQTRIAGERGHQWISTGEGQFEIDDYPKLTRGTDIILHLKKDSEEFLKEYTLRNLVKKYSDFVEFPVCMDVEKSDYPVDKDGKPDYKAEPIKRTEEETFNSREAIWLKPKSKVTEDEYKNFYKHISHDFSEPLKTIHYSAEGTSEFKALMYIPSKAPFDLFRPESIKGLHLYINRVFIMDECKKLLPEYLRFVKGVVDSSDLPLNVSREILQENPQLEKIKKNLVSKILSVLKDLKENENENYLKFYGEFGPVLKEGLHYDFSNKDKIADLLLFETTTSDGKLKSLKEYVEGMKGDQKEIYYISAESKAKALGSPQLEVFKSKGLEVLLMTDPVDEWVLPHLNEYDKKPLKAVHQGDVKFDDEKEEDAREIEKKEKEHGDVLKAVKEVLKDKVKDVKFSKRLVDSVACLTAGEGAMNAQMEQMMRAMGQAVPKQQKILELNPKHKLVSVLEGLHKNKEKSDTFNSYVSLIFDQAMLTDGAQLEDALGFAKRVSELMVNAAG
jgi:molecular chaperone HtpG